MERTRGYGPRGLGSNPSGNTIQYTPVVQWLGLTAYIRTIGVQIPAGVPRDNNLFIIHRVFHLILYKKLDASFLYRAGPGVTVHSSLYISFIDFSIKILYNIYIGSDKNEKIFR